MLIGALLLGIAVGTALVAGTLAVGGTLVQAIAVYVIGGCLVTLIASALLVFTVPSPEGEDESLLDDTTAVGANS